MPPLALTDSELEIVSTMAAPLPPSQRAAFLQALADALARYAAEVRVPAWCIASGAMFNTAS
jgi:predicted NBD/HSP70 family sugar kinase